MDRLSVWSALLLFLYITGETYGVTRKKIRIHIPQKVKHIHHHKKIYITQHQAQPTQFAPQFASSETYAPQYASSAYSSPALLGEPSSTVSVLDALLLPEERRSARPAPNLQPQYRARGHYGPPATSMRAPAKPNKAAKTRTKSNVQVIKISEGKKKRIIKMKKPKRIVIQDNSKENEQESTFHEEFYSDIKPEHHKNIKTLRKPKRVEKFVDGDTEHIHTYSEEHIHQYVYDDPPADMGGKAPGSHEGASSGLAYAVDGVIPSPHALLPLDVALHHAMRAPVALPSHTGYHALLPAAAAAYAAGAPSYPSGYVGGPPLIHAGTPGFHSSSSEYPAALPPIHPTYNSLLTASPSNYHSISPSPINAFNSIQPTPITGLFNGYKSTPTIPSINNLSSSYNSYGVNKPSGTNSQSLASIKPSSFNPMFDNVQPMGSLGTPSHMEYAGYNADDATHDHIYHDHGEIIQNTGLFKPIGKPTKPSFTSEAIKINPHYNHQTKKPLGGKGSWVSQDHVPKNTEHNNNFSFYDSFPSLKNKNKTKKNKIPNLSSVVGKYPLSEESTTDSDFDDFTPDHTGSYTSSSTHYGNLDLKRPKKRPTTISPYLSHSIPKKPKSTVKPYPLLHHYNNFNNKYQSQSTENKPYISDPLFAESDSYKGLKKTKNTKGTYAQKYQYYTSSDPYTSTDSYSTSSTESSNDEPFPSSWRGRKNKNSKKKSVSSQNISFGGQDHKTVIDHFAESSNISPTISSPSFLGKMSDSKFEASNVDLTYSPRDSYYNSMASKRYEEVSVVPEASNTNFRVVEAPQLKEVELPMTEGSVYIEMTTSMPTPISHMPPPSYTTTTKAPKRFKKKLSDKKKPKPSSAGSKQHAPNMNIQEAAMHKKESNTPMNRTDRGKLKYGDKLQEKYDYEDGLVPA